MEHGYADSSGVKIHYVTLASQYQTVAIDQRGYNLFGKPKGVDNYDMSLLVGDVAGHQAFGPLEGYPSRPRLGRRSGLDIRHLPSSDDRQADHPESPASARVTARELANNPQQQKNTQYAAIPAGGRAPEAHGGRAQRGLRIYRPGRMRRGLPHSDFETMLN